MMNKKNKKEKRKAEEAITETKSNIEVSKKKATKTPTKPLSEIKGYKVLPFKLANGDKGFILANIYFKQHNPNNFGYYGTLDEVNFPQSRTLFFYNLPLDFKESDLNQLIKNSINDKDLKINKIQLHCSGRVGIDPKKEKGSFVKKTTPITKALGPLFSTKDIFQDNVLLAYPNFAYVSFKTVEDMEKVINMELYFENGEFIENKLVKVVPHASKDQDSGLLRLLNKYDLSYPDPNKLQAYVDEYAGEFKHYLDMKDYEASKQHDVADADGFVKVTHTRSSNTTDNIAVKALSLKRAKILQNKVLTEGFGKPATLSNFYRFENRKSKVEDLARLRASFEEDKKRIEEMKKAKRFLPVD